MKGGVSKMILFIILLLIVMILTTFIVIGAGIGGALFVAIFGDVIVCIFLIVWCMRRLIKRKK